MTIGSRIASKRKELQLSQEEMADKIGVTRQSVSKWETDASAPDAFNLMALAEVLNTSVEYIVTGKLATEEIAKEKPNSETQTTQKRSNLAIIGFILVAGGLLISIIGMFVHLFWCGVGGFIALSGIVCAISKEKKSIIIGFSILAVIIAVVIVLLVV